MCVCMYVCMYVRMYVCIYTSMQRVNVVYQQHHLVIYCLFHEDFIQVHPTLMMIQCGFAHTYLA